MGKLEGRNSNFEKFVNLIGLISIVAVISIISFAVYKEFFYTPPAPTPVDMTELNEELKEIPNKNKWEKTDFVITNFDKAVENHLKNVEFKELSVAEGIYSSSLLKGNSIVVKLGNDEARKIIALEDIRLTLKRGFIIVTDVNDNIVFIKILTSPRRVLRIGDMDRYGLMYDDCFEVLNEYENPKITNLIATKMENIEIQKNE